MALKFKPRHFKQAAAPQTRPDRKVSRSNGQWQPMLVNIVEDAVVEITLRQAINSENRGEKGRIARFRGKKSK